MSEQQAVHRAALLSRYAAELVESMLRGEEEDHESLLDWIARLEDVGIEVEALRREMAAL